VVNGVFRRRTLVGGALGVVCGLSACATESVSSGADARNVTLPRRWAWFEGRRVEYVTTDVSDAALARALGVNHVPRLAFAVPQEDAPSGTPSSVDRVYLHRDESQISVFPSVPQPWGPDNVDPAYSPLWRVVWVDWTPGRARRELRSEEDVLAAEERGDVRLTLTRIVVNCPVTSDTPHRRLPSGR